MPTRKEDPPAEPRPITNAKAILLFIHCKTCLMSLPAGQSPATFQDLEVGWTDVGLQVWCRRHDTNVLHVDFGGARHHANTTRAGDPTAAPNH